MRISNNPQNMTVETAKLMRETLTSSITSLIENYERETGLRVTGITISRFATEFGAEPDSKFEIEIGVMLP